MLKINYKDKHFIKDVISKAFPLIVGSIVIGLISLIDNFMIGILKQNNSDELAAAALVGKYIKIINIFIIAFISMFSFLIFQYKGKNENENIQSIFKILIIFIMLIDAIAILLAWIIPDTIMLFFQGKHYNDNSTNLGLAQKYLKFAVFTLLPTSLFSIYLIGLNAYGKQKIVIPLSIISIFINATLNYLFYKTLKLGLKGIALSTIAADSIFLISIFIWIYKSKLHKYLFFNIFKIFIIKKEVFIKGFKRYHMSLQSILWTSISLGVLIIYSRWYGDVANIRLAIVMPISGMFYAALDGIASTKGYFVGTYIGEGKKEIALMNDKRINLYTFIFAAIEGIILSSFAILFTKIWTGTTSREQHDATLMLIAIGLTYPVAALSKTLIGSFKVAGMGKTIILSNGLFALLFEFLIPLVLFIVYKNTILLENLEFWQLYLIARLIKLIKLPPTIYFWKKRKWLERVV